MESGLGGIGPHVTEGIRGYSQKVKRGLHKNLGGCYCRLSQNEGDGDVSGVFGAISTRAISLSYICEGLIGAISMRCAKCECELRNRTYGSVCEDCWVDARSCFGGPPVAVARKEGREAMILKEMKAGWEDGEEETA